MATKEGKSELSVKELASMGGNARAKALKAKRRREIAIAAANARWGVGTVTTADKLKPKK